MQVFIPAGDTTLGSSQAEQHLAFLLCTRDRIIDRCRLAPYQAEEPQRTVRIPSFWLDMYEVSNAQYAQCVAAGKCTKRTIPLCQERIRSRWSAVDPDRWKRDFSAPTQPAVCVSWQQATDYCAWVGREIPTQNQWERAARGNHGRIFPWGTKPDPCAAAHSFDPRTGEGCGTRKPTSVTSPSGTSPFGVAHLAGNAQEWVWNTTLRSNKQLVKGGSWASEIVALRGASKELVDMQFTSVYTGFRCVQNEAQETF